MKRGGGNAGLAFPLDSDFTPFSVKIGQTGLGILSVFRVKRLRFLFSGVEMGLSALVSVSNIRWKSARKEGAALPAHLCPVGQL